MGKPKQINNPFFVAKLHRQLVLQCFEHGQQINEKNLLTSIPTDYIDNYCSNTLDMGRAQVTAGRLLLRRPGEDLRFENCFMFIKAPANRRLILKFHSFDVPAPYGCDKDSLQLFDGAGFQRPLTGRVLLYLKLQWRCLSVFEISLSLFPRSLSQNCICWSCNK